MSTTNRTLQAAFNTGAFYSPKGQRIAVWMRKAEAGHVDRCCLVDFDRQICCQFPARMTSAMGSVLDLGMHAMHMYQLGQYDLVLDQGEDAVVRGEMADVLAKGYDAFIQSPEVQVIASMAARLRSLH
ncbi:hypothetical protein RA210_U10446 [Rubrivivax sp. A210]|uniref:hypothetical protein n=1 Tax=Rubrivivax sp. A210 TaxID=2772301 RepID=UPI00191B46ED|nr:hypothetical protein [Rubrivivax sp. A210]CAD5366679.1 hypothetical protein RA210_U10446 [Rubrivivax sp. A210]